MARKIVFHTAQHDAYIILITYKRNLCETVVYHNKRQMCLYVHIARGFE